MGDFNANESNPAMETFLNQHKCKNIIKSKTCYKSQEGSCIDLIITSRHSLHQFSHAFETGISDYHLTGLYHAEIHKVRTKNCKKTFL